MRIGASIEEAGNDKDSIQARSTSISAKSSEEERMLQEELSLGVAKYMPRRLARVQAELCRRPGSDHNKQTHLQQKKG